jgi:hypothetical protein
MSLDCPVCQDESGIKGGFDELGEDHKCHACGAALEMHYDETWDGEEEHGWFHLETAESKT